MTALGWIFFVGFWVFVALNLILLLADIRLAASLNQARDLLQRVEHNTTGELQELILEYLHRTRP